MVELGREKSVLHFFVLIVVVLAVAFHFLFFFFLVVVVARLFCGRHFQIAIKECEVIFEAGDVAFGLL